MHFSNFYSYPIEINAYFRAYVVCPIKRTLYGIVDFSNKALKNIFFLYNATCPDTRGYNFPKNGRLYNVRSA